MLRYCPILLHIRELYNKRYIVYQTQNYSGINHPRCCRHPWFNPNNISKATLQKSIQHCPLKKRIQLRRCRSTVKPLIMYKPHPIQTLICFSSRLAVVFSKSIEARSWVVNEDVAGASPTSEWSTSLFPAKMPYIRGLEVHIPLLLYWHLRLYLTHWPLRDMVIII